jgi:hypothetical protein
VKACPAPPPRLGMTTGVSPYPMVSPACRSGLAGDWNDSVAAVSARGERYDEGSRRCSTPYCGLGATSHNTNRNCCAHVRIGSCGCVWISRYEPERGPHPGASPDAVSRGDPNPNSDCNRVSNSGSHSVPVPVPNSSDRQSPARPERQTGNGGLLGPRGLARARESPAARSLRNSVMLLPYRPSRRMIAPLAPDSVAWSSSWRTAALYAPLKRRRVGLSGTSGSGILSIGQGCTPARGSAALIAISGTSVPALAAASTACTVARHGPPDDGSHHDDDRRSP